MCLRTSSYSPVGLQPGGTPKSSNSSPLASPTGDYPAMREDPPGEAKLRPLDIKSINEGFKEVLGRQISLQSTRASGSLSVASPAMAGSHMLYGKYRSPSLPVNAFTQVALPSNVEPISPSSMGRLMDAEGSLLVVDVRPYAQYASSRIRNATNICIPSTLLKRQTYVLERFAECMVPSQKDRLLNVDEYKHIVLYDGSSADFAGVPSAHASLLHTMLKFANAPEVKATVYYLKGGLNEFSKVRRDLVDTQSVNSVVPMNALNLPPVKTGFDASDASPFDSAFRDIYDYGDDITASLKLPVGVTTETAASIFPKWLAEMAGKDGPRLVAKRFYDIEQAEKSRLRSAFAREQKYDGIDKSNFSVSAGVESGYKNRYNNIWPYDHTRVILSGVERNSCDYINASYISSALSGYRYIATQAPLPDTFKDFWKVVWDERIPVIMTLSAVSEGGQIKCHEYWQSRKYKAGRFWVQVVEETDQPLGQDTDTVVTLRKFRLSEDGNLASFHNVVQIHYTSWPDLGSPASPQDLLALCRLKGSIIDLCCKTDQNIPDGKPKALVHCSAGCGRTGAFCTVDSVIDIMSRGDPTTGDDDLVFRVVHDFRTQRLSMVQSLRQYALCYETVMYWCKLQHDRRQP